MSSTATRPIGREGRDPAPTTPATPSPAAEASDPLTVEVDGLRYELDRPPSKGGRKAILTVRLTASGECPPLVLDRCDLYAHKQRERLAALVAEKTGKSEGEVLGQLALLLDQAERALGQEKKHAPVVLTAARKQAAEKLLARRDLLDRVSSAIGALGLVGEERNRRLCYLVATSRLLTRPLSTILRAPAATGKSELLDRVGELMPEESVETMSRLTPGALFYLGADYLRHKLVLVDEQVGASEAEHPIRVLQSSGRLTLATVVKGKAERFTVNGPIALMSGTTAHDLNAENLSRCLELALDDSPEQTQRIHEAQRRAWAGDEASKLDASLFQDAQRLLESLPVRIPFATKLRFPVRHTKDRRDQPKLLGLVAAHALLHQRQREQDDKGRLVATVADYRAAFELYAPLVEAEFEDLSPRAASLYRALTKRREREREVSRRDAASLMGWSYTTTRRALDELQAHELLRVSELEAPKLWRVLEVPATENLSLTPPDELDS